MRDEPGEIDNSDLQDNNGSLRKGLSEKYDYILLPESVFNTLVSWYGKSTDI